MADSNGHHRLVQTRPIVSNTISTSKQKLTIIIEREINLQDSAAGGSEVCLLVKRLEKDQKPIFVEFFDDEGWSSSVKIDTIHYKCALVFKAPAYKNQSLTADAKVNLKLYVPNIPNNFDKNKTTTLNNQLNDDKSLGSISSDSLLNIKYESQVVEFTYLAS